MLLETKIKSLHYRHHQGRDVGSSLCRSRRGVADVVDIICHCLHCHCICPAVIVDAVIVVVVVGLSLCHGRRRILAVVTVFVVQSRVQLLWGHRGLVGVVCSTHGRIAPVAAEGGFLVSPSTGVGA